MVPLPFPVPPLQTKLGLSFLIYVKFEMEPKIWDGGVFIF